MKRFLSLLLVFALVLSCTPAMPIQVQAATGEQSAFEGYTPISNKEELDAIRNDLDGKYYLTADIVFADEDFAEGGAFYNDGAKWIPIGTSSAPFTGIFDGNGHTITGLSVLVKNTENAVGGLFGYVSSSNSEYGIFNLGMISDYILVSNASGTSYAGSVAGYCEMGKIEGCYHTGHVAVTNTSGEIYAGGIVGYKQYGEINKCYNTGSVVGGGITGGIVGGTTYASVSNCYNNTKFSGKYAGGIVGSANFGTVDTCYSLGTNTSSYGSGFAGGIVGMNGNCTVSNSYYDASTTSGGGTYKSASAMQTQSTFSGFDFTDVWSMDGNSDYPYPELQGVIMQYKRTLTGISVGTVPTKTVYLFNEEELDATGGVITLTYNDGSTLSIAMTTDMISGFNKLLLGEQTLTVSYEGKTTTFKITVVQAPVENTTEFLGGFGIPDNPYLIANVTHLNNVRNYLDACFLMVCDITFPANAEQWIPIGTDDQPFTGAFDGGNHKIKGLGSIAMVGNGAGLFGAVSDCEIKNVQFANGKVAVQNYGSQEYYVGTLVGKASAAFIQNCHCFQPTYAYLTGDDGYCGALIGYASDTIVVDCTNTGAVTLKQSRCCFVGGIVGWQAGGEVRHSTNSGKLYAYGYDSTNTTSSSDLYAYVSVGGIVGKSTGTIVGCANRGQISADAIEYTTYWDQVLSKGDIYLGGIVGTGASTIQQCYNVGKLMVGSSIGGIGAGIAARAKQISDCFNTGIIEFTGAAERTTKKCGIAYYADNLTRCYSLSYPVSKSELDKESNPYCYDYFGYGSTAMLEKDPYAQSTYEGFDFDTVWTMGSGVYPYPVLDGADVPWKLTAIAIESLPNKLKYHVGTEPFVVTGAKIKLEYNGVFTGDTLVVTPEMVTGYDINMVGIQTLTITYQSHTTQFEVDVRAEDFVNFVGGIGTQTYPYIIETEEQLRNIAIETDAYYVLNNDIVVTSEQWTPLPPFSGSFNGNGHTISGLYITTDEQYPESNLYLGLFETNSGHISRLNVEGTLFFESEYTYKSYTAYAGGIAGQNAGTIEQCSVNMEISLVVYCSNYYDRGGTGGYRTFIKSAYAGGIVGNNNGTIKNCYVNGTVYAESVITRPGAIIDGGDAYAGGITTKNYGTVESCYSIADVSAKTEDYYSDEEVYDIASAFEKCYCPKQGDVDYAGFDFDNVWGIDFFSGYDHPQFLWQLKEMTRVNLVEGSSITIGTVEGLWPDMSAFTARATYADGTTKDIALIPALLKELDINRVGTQTVHLTCGDIISKETITFVIKEKEPTTLEIKKMPNKLSYVQGQPLDLDDGVLILTYSNNTTVDVNLVDAQLSYDTDAIGTVTVTATYEGLTVSFDITVNERIVKSVVLTQPAKLSYIEGQELDLTGGIVTVTYVSGDNYSEQIPLEISMLSGYDKSIVGIQIVTFSYLDHSETFAVRVVENKVVSLEISKLPQKLIYDVCKEQLDVTGGKIIVTYLDGSTKEIEITESMVSGFDNARIGTQTLTVNYEDVTTTYMVEICATVPDSVEIHTLPTKCYYFTGETLDLTGLALKAHYGEKVAIITAFDDVAEVDMTTAGIKAVSVTFQGIETVFSVYVHEEKTDVISVDSSLYPESSHNYSNNLNETKTFTYPGAVSLTITFNSQTSVESNYDYIYIYDGNDTQIAKYTGTAAANKTLTITGDTFKVKLTSDSSQVKYGYAFSSIKATTKGTIHPAVTDPATATCTQAGLTEGSHCEICGMVLVEQEEMAALGHDYEAAFSWNEDHSACTYILTCSRCADVQTIDCTVAVTDVTQQHTTHSTTVEYEGQEYNDTFICDHALITFENWDGTQLSSNYYHIGAEIAVPIDPTKAADNTYTYTFAGWDKEVVNCAGDATYTATYESSHIDYVVKFLDEDGSVISEKAYHYGDKVIAPAVPTKAADNTYTYTFAGWDKAIVDCVGDATYIATYTPSYIDYTVVFKDWDGTVISTKTHHYGDEVTVPSNPTKAADNTYTYTFAGWDKAVVNCAGNATYTATYTPSYINYTIVFKNWNGSVISTKTYHYGDKVTVPADPTKAADNAHTYTFSGWDKEVVNCAGDAVYTATYIPAYIDYMVVFKNWDGTVLSTATYHYGDKVTIPADPTKAADNTYTYTFAGWDKAVVNCAGNATYTATYTPTYIDYTIVFKNWNGDVLSTKTYHWGDKVTTPANPTREADKTYTYTFAGWDKEVVNCAGDAVYAATYTPTYIDYTIVFKNWDGSVISTTTYHYGDKVVAPANPTKAADNTYTYTFASWDKEVVDCAGNVIYTATYTPSYIDYTVVFKNWDGTVLSTKVYHYGDTVTEPATPTKPADETYTYAFASWDKEVVNCAGNATYTATYTPTYINYTVVFKNWNGTVLSTKTYHWGDKVTTPANPTREADKTYTFTFAGWDKEVVNCAGDAVYAATYTPTYIDYTIVFKNWDGSVISTMTYHYGDKVVAPANPTKAADNTYTYTFASWDKEVVDCAGNVIYTATYTPSYIDYTVVFKDWDGTVISTKTYHYGDKVTAPTNPTKAADNTYTYTFKGWDQDVVDCTGNATYTATYDAVYIDYTVVFKNWDGTVISSDTYHWGEDVIAPADPVRPDDDRYAYTFTGWDKTVVNCAGNATYTAQYTAVYKNYTITFKNWDGTVLSTKTYHWGDRVAEPATPTKPADNTATYAFAGWDKTVVNCAGDATYTAQYTTTYKNYTITFKNWDGTVISTKTYHYGDAVTAPSNPTRSADNTYTYAFKSWDKTVTNCTGNAIYTAQYTAIYRNYTVVFKNWDGTVLSSKTYHYGDMVTVPSNPTKAADNTYTYTFKGWDKTVVNCTGNATCTAQYTAVYKNYTITFKNWDGSVVSTKTYHYGDKVTAPAAPTRPNDENFEYTFTGWDKEVVNCAGNATYTAVYSAKSLVPSTITSSVFTINGSNISKISIGTTVAKFLEGLNEKQCVKAFKGNTEVSGSTLVGTGMVVKIMDGNTVKATYTLIVTGDINGDGKLTVTDFVQMQAHLLNKTPLQGAAAKAADTSGDGKISVTDYVQIQAHILGKSAVQPRSV